MNGKPIEVLEPKPLREKAYSHSSLEENIKRRCSCSCQGGGSVAQTYAIRQSIAKGIVSFYQKCTYRSFITSSMTFSRGRDNTIFKV